MRLLPISFLFILICVSCDPSTSYSRIVKNASTHEMYVIKKNFPVCDTTTIGVGEEYTVYKTNGMVSTDKYENCEFESFQSDTFLLKVKDNPALTVNANMMSNQNWQYSVQKRSKMTHGGVCSCKLTITDDMIN